MAIIGSVCLSLVFRHFHWGSEVRIILQFQKYKQYKCTANVSHKQQHIYTFFNQAHLVLLNLQCLIRVSSGYEKTTRIQWKDKSLDEIGRDSCMPSHIFWFVQFPILNIHVKNNTWTKTFTLVGMCHTLHMHEKGNLPYLVRHSKILFLH